MIAPPRIRAVEGGKVRLHIQDRRSVNSVETSYFYGPAMTFIYNDVFKRPQTQEDLDKATAALDFTAGILDKHPALKLVLASSFKEGTLGGGGGGGVPRSCSRTHFPRIVGAVLLG